MVGRKFRTIGRAEVFTVMVYYLAAGEIPTVKGRSAKHETIARVEDIVFLTPWELELYNEHSGDCIGIAVKRSGLLAVCQPSLPRSKVARSPLARMAL